MERLHEAVTTRRHGLGTDSDTNLDATHADLVGYILDGFEAGGAEAVNGGGTGGDWVPRREHSGAGNVCGFAVAHLCIVSAYEDGEITHANSGQAYVAQANILNHVGVDLRFLEDFFQQSVDQVVQIRVLKAALLAFGQRRSDGKGDNNIVRVLGGSSQRYFVSGEVQRMGVGAGAHMADKPVLPPVNCETMEPSLWVAMVSWLFSMPGNDYGREVRALEIKQDNEAFGGRESQVCSRSCQLRCGDGSEEMIGSITGT